MAASRPRPAPAEPPEPAGKRWWDSNLVTSLLVLALGVGQTIYLTYHDRQMVNQLASIEEQKGWQQICGLNMDRLTSGDPQDLEMAMSFLKVVDPERYKKVEEILKQRLMDNLKKKAQPLVLKRQESQKLR